MLVLSIAFLACFAACAGDERPGTTGSERRGRRRRHLSGDIGTDRWECDCRFSHWCSRRRARRLSLR